MSAVAWQRVIGTQPDEFATRLAASRPEWAVGTLSRSDARFLFRCSLEAEAAVAVEIGTGSGFSTSVLCQALHFASRAGLIDNDFRVFSYDAHERFYADTTRLVGDAAREQLPSQLLDHVVFRNPTGAPDARKDHRLDSIRLAFIDGSHRHPWPTLDLIAILDVLAVGADVVLHDINLPLLPNATEPLWGAKHVFDSLSAHKKVADDFDPPNIGSFSVPPDKEALRAELLEALESREWETSVPKEKVAAALARAAPTGAVAEVERIGSGSARAGSKRARKPFTATDDMYTAHDRLNSLLHRLPKLYEEYSPPTEAVGMTTPSELCFLESYARDVFCGAGRIVDLGCWFGATTAALARGLTANTLTTDNRIIEAFDLFTWEAWMNRHIHRLPFDRAYQPGDSFLSDVGALLFQYRAFVNLKQCDLQEPLSPGRPIEFLFVDAAKSWSLTASIVKSFFPSLIPGRSLVVQQDFVWYHPTVVSTQMLMWYMRDHFEFVHHVPGACSAVFLHTNPIDPMTPALSATLFDKEMIDEAYDYSYECASPDGVAYLRAAKALFLIERGFYEPALEEARKLFDGAYLPHDLAAGVKGVVRQWRSRSSAEAWDEVGMSADAVLRDVEALIPGD